MDQPLCKLTLVYPIDSSDIFVDFILSCDPAVPGFTSWQVDGHGHGFEKASISERVRGHVKRGTLVTIMPEKQAKLLLEKIRQEVTVPHLTYWTEPVTAFGQLK